MATPAKSKLKGRNPATVEASKPKIVVYGAPGVGKTFASIEFPNVYYIDTEGGADMPQYREKLKTANALYFGPDDGSLDFPSVLEQVHALATEEHDRNTLVIDSVSKLFNNQIALTQERMARSGIEDAFGASKKEAIGYMRRLVALIDKLDMNVILIHHSKSQWKDGKEIGDTFDGWEKLGYELHLILKIGKEGPVRRAYVTKSRLTQFPDGSNFPWSFAEFSKRYGEDVIGRPAVKANLATPEQQETYKSLMGKVKVQQDILDKWESAVPDVSLLESSSMAKRIEWLEAQHKAQQTAA